MAKDDRSIDEVMREQALNTAHSGTSVFTHVDDAGADIHMSTEEGARHLFYGDEMTPKHQLEEVVLGPAPFGSPDPRTLGHRMVPLQEGPASAPELDPDFQKSQKSALSGNNEESLDELTKDELLERAESLGIEVNKSATKEEIKQAIANGGEDEEDETPSYSGMNKAELLDEASKRGLDVDESNSKAEILEALEGDDKNE